MAHRGCCSRCKVDVVTPVLFRGNADSIGLEAKRHVDETPARTYLQGRAAVDLGSPRDKVVSFTRQMYRRPNSGGIPHTRWLKCPF